MTFRYIKRTLVGFIFLIAVYFGLVFIWSSVTVSTLLDNTSRSDHLTKLSSRYLDALIKIEDPTFYEHSGLDVSKGQGLTTITSVVARMVFLDNFQLDGVAGVFQSFYRAVFSCCKSIDMGRDLMALVLDAHLGKQDQLNTYMANSYLGYYQGRQVIGFEDAALTYYGKALSTLTESEFHGIVAMLIAPDYFHPVKNPELHAQRVARIRLIINGQCEPAGWLDLTYEHCVSEH